jgi:D-inositol-3-phosphate glycosyltransferase
MIAQTDINRLRQGGQKSEVGDRSADGRNLSSAICRQPSVVSNSPSSVACRPVLRIALLTGGSDKSYVLGLTEALTSEGVSIDVIGSDELSTPELLTNSRIRFLNLRGDQRSDVSLKSKTFRILRYYVRLLCYSVVTQPKIFHILWNNKFEFFDRTLLLLYYKLLGKRLVFTAHNVNIRKRDCSDSWLNRLSLRVQYQLVDHILVHTERMKSELLTDFGVPESKTSVIPFGINNTSPVTAITTGEARQRLRLSSSDKTLLFFGQIAPYKGLEYLIDAFNEVAKNNGSYRLVIAGTVKKGQIKYWSQIRSKTATSNIQNQIIERIEHVPDEEVELYFKAADVLIVPYVHIFQSGVPFLAYSFGLPVIATDVGSLRQDIIEGRTGFVCRREDPSDLARMINEYFESDLFKDLENRRSDIKNYANERYSWEKVAAITTGVYSRLLTSDS